VLDSGRVPVVADLVRPVGGWCGRGEEQCRIGYGDGGREIAYARCHNGRPPHISLIAAFVGDSGEGVSASERAVGLRLE
jgi:hypothetical protein